MPQKGVRGFQKGEIANPQGRPKGIPSGKGKNAREAIQEAFDGIGGVKSLMNWAKESKNRKDFYSMYAKLLPLVHAGDTNQPVIFQLKKGDEKVL